MSRAGPNLEAFIRRNDQRTPRRAAERRFGGGTKRIIDKTILGTMLSIITITRVPSGAWQRDLIGFNTNSCSDKVEGAQDPRIALMIYRVASRNTQVHHDSVTSHRVYTLKSQMWINCAWSSVSPLPLSPSLRSSSLSRSLLLDLRPSTNYMTHRCSAINVASVSILRGYFSCAIVDVKSRVSQ